MDGSGEAIAIFSGRSVDLNLGSKVAAGLQAGVLVAVEGVDGSFPSRLKVGASSGAPTFSIAV